MRLTIVLCLLAAPAMAHDWYTGERSNDGRFSCCSGRDCAAISGASVHCGAKGCDVILEPGQHPQAPKGGRFLFRGAPRPSPDGETHVCIWWHGPEQKGRGDYDGVIRCMWFGGMS